MNKGLLFSTYRQGENRVTASMLAVFERIDLAAVERLLQAASEESSLQLVRFENQVKGVASVPDASISANFRYYFEVKTSRDQVDEIQLQNHLMAFTGGPVDERLFVLTPDEETPAAVEEIGDKRLTWFSFRALSDATDDLLGAPEFQLADRETFLLRELQQLFAADGLLSLPEDVVIVAARRAYPFYRKVHAYRCQRGRAFRDGLRYLGFYTAKEIKPEIASIVGIRDDIVVSEETAGSLERSDSHVDRRVADAVRATLEGEPELHSWIGKFFVLTGPDDPDTLLLGRPIEHDRRGAWTQGQRYAISDDLRQATRTSDLLSER